MLCLYLILPLTVSARQQPASPEVEVQSFHTSEAERGPLLSLVAIVLGLGLFGGWQLYRQAYRQAQFIKHPERLREARQHLLLRIARLDDRYAQRLIGGRVYHRKRDRLKQQALDLTLQGMTEHD
jgi:hypothetical protein